MAPPPATLGRAEEVPGGRGQEKPAPGASLYNSAALAGPTPGPGRALPAQVKCKNSRLQAARTVYSLLWKGQERGPRHIESRGAQGHCSEEGGVPTARVTSEGASPPARGQGRAPGKGPRGGPAAHSPPMRGCEGCTQMPLGTLGVSRPQEGPLSPHPHGGAGSRWAGRKVGGVLLLQPKESSWPWAVCPPLPGVCPAQHNGLIPGVRWGHPGPWSKQAEEGAGGSPQGPQISTRRKGGQRGGSRDQKRPPRPCLGQERLKDPQPAPPRRQQRTTNLGRVGATPPGLPLPRLPHPPAMPQESIGAGTRQAWGVQGGCAPLTDPEPSLWPGPPREARPHTSRLDGEPHLWGPSEGQAGARDPPGSRDPSPEGMAGCPLRGLIGGGRKAQGVAGRPEAMCTPATPARATVGCSHICGTAGTRWGVSLIREEWVWACLSPTRHRPTLGVCQGGGGWGGPLSLSSQ